MANNNPGDDFPIKGCTRQKAKLVVVGIVFFLCGISVDKLIHVQDEKAFDTNDNRHDGILRARTSVFSRGITKSTTGSLPVSLHENNSSSATKFHTLTYGKVMKGNRAKGENNENLIHWCVLGYDNSGKNAHLYFYHFPHAAESILPCWSWFRSQNALDRCGIVLLGYRKPAPAGWMGQLLTAMNCTVRSVAVFPEVQEQRSDDKKKSPEYVNPQAPFHDPNGIFYAVPRWWKMPRDLLPRYLLEPMDAWTLRQRVVSDDTIIRHKQKALAAVYQNSSTTSDDDGGDGDSSSVLQIGLIQRISSARILLNLTELETALQDAFPTAIVSTTTLANASLYDQALWFATQDIIIGAHGASMTNSLFILPETIVYQLYPKYYFFQSLEPLIQQVGGYALSYSPNTEEFSPTWEYLAKRPRAHWRNLGRTLNITFEATVIVQHLREFLEEQRRR